MIKVDFNMINVYVNDAPADSTGFSISLNPFTV